MKTKKLVCYNCGGHGFITATYENGRTSAICPVCGGIGAHEIQMTNADRIRAMSDEELRNWLFRRDCKNIAAFLQHGGAGVMDAVQLLDWLQQPAEEDEHG